MKTAHSDTSTALQQMLLRMGDSTLVLGHRISEWCGHAPVLEEDIAMANIALDFIGQTQFWLGMAAELEAEGRIEEAEEVISAPVTYVAPVPVSAAPKFDGRAYKTAPVYKVKVKNRITFLKNVKPETLLECLNEAAWTTIESGLSRKAKALGKAFSQAGCEVYES